MTKIYFSPNGLKIFKIKFLKKYVYKIIGDENIFLANNFIIGDKKNFSPKVSNSWHHQKKLAGKPSVTKFNFSSPKNKYLLTKINFVTYYFYFLLYVTKFYNSSQINLI